jgi:hypothetical protein
MGPRNTKSAKAKQSKAKPAESKHARRRERRELYYEMIDSELPLERAFSGRVIDTINHSGLDIAPDGRPIKSNWWHYMQTRDGRRSANAHACLYLLEKTYRSTRPKIAI